MARLAPARAAALEVASERRRRDARARDLLRSSACIDALDDRDRSLATRLVMGSVAAEGELDRVIASHLRPGSHMEPRVRDALRLAVFELLYLSTPDAIVVSQGVELVRFVTPRAAGLANAVLHRVAEEDAPALEAARARVTAGECTPSDLALVGAWPLWLAAALADSVGMPAACRMAATALDAAGVYVSPNLARASESEAEALLAKAGCEPSPTGDGAFALAAPARLARSGLVQSATVVPADLAARHVALLAAPVPGQAVLEVGQGRGTKTIIMESAAIAAGGRAPITSVEVDGGKVALSRRRMEAAGIADVVTCVEFDARDLARDDLPPALDRAFGVVLVDAPCSGTGTLRRHPEIAWSLDPASVDPTAADSLCALQLAILTAASARVLAGGSLVYSTCSVLRSEDEQVVEAFLASPAGASFAIEGEPGRVCLDDGRSDTHFSAILRREP